LEADSERLIRILLIDDNPYVREGLAALLNCQHDMEVIAEAENGKEGIKQFSPPPFSQTVG
jgi:YesN/AraC family two-component response regulator